MEFEIPPHLSPDEVNSLRVYIFKNLHDKCYALLQQKIDELVRIQADIENLVQNHKTICEIYERSAREFSQKKTSASGGDASASPKDTTYDSNSRIKFVNPILARAK
jgi:hypothetical protein